MKLTITPTEKFAMLRGHPVREWEGTSEAGSRVYVFVAGVAPEDPVHWPEIRDSLKAELPSAEGLFDYAAETLV